MTDDYMPALQDDELDLFDFFDDDDNADIELTPSERRQMHRRQQGGGTGRPAPQRGDRSSNGRSGQRRPKSLLPRRKPGPGRRASAEVQAGRRARKAPEEAPAGQMPEGAPQAAPPMRRRKRPLGESILRLVIKIGVIAAVTFVLTQIVGGVFVAHDNNMFPAVRDGDLCITYRLGGYYNGDVVAFEHGGITTFGRVVGIPGDVIDIREETGFTVNGMTPYEVVYYKTLPQDPTIAYPYAVRDGEIFVLCDQREDAQDSRTFGPVKKPKGKVVLQLRRRGF